MNITSGNGLITISNLTIKNCWNPGPSSNDYKTSTVDNYGNLAVNNVSFIFNHGGVGGAIRNNHGANINITNSLFEANRKSSSTGNYGAGIYNNGTAIIINSIFQKNYARWGTITNDKNLTIINSTIQDNIAYDGASTFKTGSGITINTGSTTYGETVDITDIITEIEGCTFINNDQLDIYSDLGRTNITNNIFNKSTGVVFNQGDSNIVISIKNNIFDSPIGSSLYTTLSSKNQYIVTLKLGGSYKYNIDSNRVLNITGTTSKALELTTSNSNITNNTFERLIYIKGEKNTISKNNITTTKDTYAIDIKDSRNNKICENYLKASVLLGNSAINYTSPTTIIENNLPEVKELQINDETFYRYFDDNGNLLSNYAEIELIQIIGSLNNKNINLTKKVNIIQKGKITSNNITITTNNEIEISTLNIINTNKEPVIILNGNNGIIKTTTLTTNNNYTIVVNGENNTIEANTLVADILVGDESVKTNKQNNINLNLPSYKNYILSNDNFYTYFNNDGTIKTTDLDELHFLVNGTIQNKDIILNNNKPIIITNYKDAKFVNTQIRTTENTTLNISYISIENTDKIAFNLASKENIIAYTNITSNTTAINTMNTTKIVITYNNIITKLDKNIQSINIINATNVMINYTNIQTTGFENITSINIEDTKITSIYNNNITTQSNILAKSIKITNTEIISQNKLNIYENNITTNSTNPISIELYNQSPQIQYNEITPIGNGSIGIKWKV